ncbi:SPW repeat protein [Amycolatopsis sp. OK19-0408]|uniref:SPW repeat protein n=1 Tax=Amycolatopsis iheyensis TaxID=2945988 RepID=A0A9X2SNM3_9PSEU|nr:SPW repeat protein [Amycolatopsis iheyensis]MCR6488964.1 SPW repeat protein [Amycolatopsis iheyensis]
MVTRGGEQHFWIGPGTEGALTPSLPSSLAFVAALWLGFAPYVLHFSQVRHGLADSIDVLVALVVAVLALVRTVVPRDYPAFSVVNAALGLWLIVAPFLLGYDLTRVIVTDLVVGVLLLGLSGLSAVLTYRQRAKAQAGDLRA